MDTRQSWWLMVSLVLSAAGAGCSSSPPEKPASDAGTVADGEAPLTVADAGAQACTLAYEPTGVAACDQCIGDRCCGVVNTCLGDDACSAVNDCYNGCAARPVAERDPCVRACVSGKDREAQMLLDMLECVSDRCKSACSG